VTSGILLVDKPTGITSHDVVSRVRKLAGTRKVGHAGTLDPMATGLLLVGIDSSTRLLTYFVGLDKEYEATILLGFATTTDDADGDPLTPVSDTAGLTLDAITAAIQPLTGPIEQVPSAVSAIKVDGKRAYARVRDGEQVELAGRPVTVSTFEVRELRRNHEDGTVSVDVRVECSSGTYIRALARDLGAALGVGGHLTALRRTRVGPFDVREAGQLGDGLMERLLAPASAATMMFPSVDLSSDEVLALSRGQRVRLEGLTPEMADHAGPLAAIGPDGVLTGLLYTSDGVARVLVNFPTSEVVAS